MHSQTEHSSLMYTIILIKNHAIIAGPNIKQIVIIRDILNCNYFMSNIILCEVFTTFTYYFKQAILKQDKQ